MKFAILTPSRQRPGRLDNFIQSIYKTCDDKENVFTYNYIDSDDPRLTAYEDYSKKQPKNNINVIGDPISVSKSWNILAEKAIDNGADILIMGNDDLLYHTNKWDTAIIEETKNFPDHIYCMWFDDLLSRGDHCAFPIISKTWYKTLGYFTPGIFNFGYNDTWIFDIAKRIGRTHYISHIQIEHLKGKLPQDDTWHRNRSTERGNFYELDKVIFEKTTEDRAKAALLLLQMIDGPHEKY